MRKEYNNQESKEYLNARKTAGRKGLKLPRLNLSLTPEKYEYLRLMSSMTGTTYSEFIEEALDAHKRQHEETYIEALQLKNKVLENR